MKIIGNIGREPENLQTNSGKPYIRFTVAESWGKEDSRVTNWFSVAFFGKAEDMAPFTKGSRVEVEGDLKTNVKDGKIYLDLLSSRVKAAPLPPKKEGAPAAAAPAPAPAAGADNGDPVAAGGVKDQFNDLDDDIPF